MIENLEDRFCLLDLKEFTYKKKAQAIVSSLRKVGSVSSSPIYTRRNGTLVYTTYFHLDEAIEYFKHTEGRTRWLEQRKASLEILLELKKSRLSKV